MEHINFVTNFVGRLTVDGEACLFWPYCDDEIT